MQDVFQARAFVQILDHIQKAKDSPQVRQFAEVFEIQDLPPAATAWMSHAFESANPVARKHHMMTAFWTTYCKVQNYQGTARGFVNPPTTFGSLQGDAVVISTHEWGRTAVGCVLLSLEEPGSTRVEIDATLNALEGDEKGFFREIVIFCDGFITPRAATKLAMALKAHLLPGSTALIFEYPNPKLCQLWTTLFDIVPEDDINNVINAITGDGELAIEGIETKDDGPLCTAFFGVKA
jgi:hypothetical protein